MNNFDNIVKKALGKKSASPSFNTAKFFSKSWKQRGTKKDWDFDGIANKKDCQPFNTMRQDKPGGLDIIGYGHRKVIDKITGEEKTIRYPIYPETRKTVKLKDAVDVAASPWMTYDEKLTKLKEMGASSSMIQNAFRQVNDRKKRYARGGRW